MKKQAREYIAESYKLGSNLTKTKQKEIIKYCQELFGREKPKPTQAGNITNWLKYIGISHTVGTMGNVMLDGTYVQEFAEKYFWYRRGIYAIIEPYTGCLLYIGKTADCFGSRWDTHRFDLENNRHCNMLLQWQYKEGAPFEIEPGIYEDYGFRFQAIHVCSDEATDEEISMLENYYINILNPAYNIVRKKLNKEELEWIEQNLIQ